MISLILAQKILTLFIMMAMGALLVRTKLMKVSEGKVISMVALYLIVPCSIFSAFQVEYSDQIRNGLILAAGVALLLHIGMIGLTGLLSKFIKLDAVEKASVIYSNSGNLIIPLVTSILGKEWVIYSTGFLCVQMILMWSHGKIMICEEPKVDLKKILLNINMIVIALGLVCFFTQIKLPKVFLDAVESMGSMIGPSAMLVTGMLIGSVDFKTLKTYRRLPLMTVLRLIVYPVLGVAFMKFSGVTNLVENGEMILMITFLAMTTPVASTITQMAQVYGKNAEYASAINVVTTLCCIVTMPVMIMLYQL